MSTSNLSFLFHYSIVKCAIEEKCFLKVLRSTKFSLGHILQ